MQSESKGPSIPRRPQKNQAKFTDARKLDEGDPNTNVSTASEDSNVSKSTTENEQSDNIEKEIPSIPRRPQRPENHEVARYEYSNDVDSGTNEYIESDEALHKFQDHGGNDLKKREEPELDAAAQQKRDGQEPSIGVPSVPRRPQKSKTNDQIHSDNKYLINDFEPSRFESNEAVLCLDSQEELKDKNYSATGNKDGKPRGENGAFYLSELTRFSDQENINTSLDTDEFSRNPNVEECSKFLGSKKFCEQKTEMEENKFKKEISEEKKTPNTSKESTSDPECSEGNEGVRETFSGADKYTDEEQQGGIRTPISYDRNPSDITNLQSNERETKNSSMTNSETNAERRPENSTTELDQSPPNEITTNKEANVPNRPRHREASPKANDIEQKSKETKNPPKRLSSKIAAFQQIIQGANRPNANGNETFQKPSNNVAHQQERQKLSSDKIQFAQNLQGMMSRGIPMPGMVDSRDKENHEEPFNEEKREDDNEVHGSVQKTRAKGPKGKRLPKAVLNAPKVDIEPRFKSTISPLWAIQFKHQEKAFTREVDTSLVMSHKFLKSSSGVTSNSAHQERTLSVITPISKDPSRDADEEGQP